MLKVKLVVVGGDAKSKEVDLRLPTVIGRGRDVTLTLPHPLVSRRHTELFEKDGRLFVKDLGSLNGTYVNNRRIEAEQRLAPNELLTLGNVTFRAIYDAVEEQPADAAVAPAVNQGERDTKAEGDEKDETVYFHQQHGEKHQKPHVRKPLKSVGTTPAEAKVQPRRDEEMLGAKANKTVGEVKASLDDVETPSDIFSGDEEFLTPEKSISVSALESLPPLTPSVSVIGSALDLGDQPQRSAIESVDLDIEGQSSRGDALKSDADLGSFLKKLPR